MTIIVDLRADKNLINSEFEKYQFCSNTISTEHEKKLEAEILRFEPNESQVSLLEARLFAFHNHLFKNPYDSTCWFIDKNSGIWKYAIDGSLHRIYISETIKSNDSVYNPSISFASKNIVVVNNGNGVLEVLELENDNYASNLLLDKIDATVILDTRFVEQNSKLIVALSKVEENQGKKFSRLIFLFYKYQINLEDKRQTFNLVQKQTVKIKRAVEHLYIEKTGTFFYITSQDQVEFDYDSVNPIKSPETIPIDNRQIKIPRYCWSQNANSITIYVKIPTKYADVSIKVETTATSISILVGDLILLNGLTLNKLKSELTTWKRNNETLEVELSKYESGLMWNELVVGNGEGEYLPNQTLAAEIHSRLSHLCSDQQETNIQGQPAISFNSEQLEDCDVSGAENLIQRINFNTHTVTHMIMLGISNHIIFSDKQIFGQALCLRYDNDGCVWLMEETDDYDWQLKHVHTFPGFGYVEASKTNKKFSVSPTDGSYVAVVEHSKNAFLYEKPEKDAKISKQKIVDFGSEISPILGAAAVNQYLIILTKNTLYQLKV